MSEFTKGPWEVHRDTLITVKNPTTRIVASAGAEHICIEGAKANAHLIAAAPDMYEALKKIITDFEDSPVQGNGEWETGLFCGLEDMGITDRYQACRHGYDKALDKVREWLIDGLDDILAKAEGKE